MNKTITTRSIITEEEDLITGTVIETRRTLKTSITAIAKQLVEHKDEAFKLASAIRFRVNEGATILEAIAAINDKKEAK
jgi:hypothetical protein